MSVKTLSGLTIFFPCYNDRGTIASMVIQAMTTGRSLTDDLEVIVIDDASTDNSRDILNELAKNYKNLKLIYHDKNLGYGATLRDGFYNATKEFIFYTDGDAQYDVRELKKLAGGMKSGVDIVNGYKIRRSDPLHRKLIGRGYHLANKVMLGIKIRDVDCDFRLIRRKVFEKVALSAEGGEICVELVKKCQDAAFVFAEVPVHHYHRVSGSSQFFHFGRIIKAIRGLTGIWKTLR